MAIGDVKASGGLQTQLTRDMSSEITSSAVSGLGDAVNRLAQVGMGYLESKTDIEFIYDRRAQSSKALELDTQFLQYQQDRAAEFTEFSRERSSNPAGLTRDYDASLAQKEDEFLKSVPPRFQEEVKAKLAQDRATRVGSAFVAELGLLDTADTNNLNESLNTLGSGLKGGGVSLEDAEAQWAEMVGKTSLPTEDQQEFIRQGRATLQGLEFGTVVEQAAKGFGSVRSGDDGSDVIAAGLLPQERAVLNAIAKNEAPNYNVWNGGSTFQGYEDHPAATSKAPGESTAAGRYQFILGTWRAATASYEKKYGVKVPDFSPEWQDRVAIHWAENQFNRHYSGGTFREILASGDPKRMLIIRDVLGKQRSSNPNDLEWQGLGHMGDVEFIQMITGQSGFAGGGTGPATAPDVWNDPKYESLSLENKIGFANAAASAAENQRKTMATQLKLERDQFLDNAYNAGYKNEPGVLASLQQSRNWDAEAQAKYNSGQEVFRAAENQVANVGKALSEGSPLSTSEVKALGAWFGEDSLAGVAAGDEASLSKMRWTVNRAKIFPDGSADAFAAAMGNPNTAPAALSFLASAIAGDSSILKRSGFDNETIANVRLYKNLAEREANADDAFKKYNAASDATLRTGKTPTQLNTEASKLFQDAYPTASSLVDKWDGWFNFRPDSKMNEATEGQLVLDASSSYQDGYRIYGTAEGAEAYMQTVLDNTWGVSQSQSTKTQVWVGGGVTERTVKENVLMRFPPEKYFPAKDNDYGYLYKGVSEFAAASGASPNGAVLVPDHITEQQVRDGKPPTYKVLGVGEFGEAMLLPERFGGEPLEAQATETIRTESEMENSLAYVNEYSMELEELQSQLDFEKRYDNQMVTSGQSGTQPSFVPELEARIGELSSKRDASVLSALEQGHIAPELAAKNQDVNAVADTFLVKLQQQMSVDNSLSRRLSQATASARVEEGATVTAKIISKELKVPMVLAEIIALKLSEAN